MSVQNKSTCATVEDRIKVAVRVRPLNFRETTGGWPLILKKKSNCVTLTSNNTLQRDNTTKDKNKFQFDHVFWSLDSPDESGGEPVGQAEVYATIGRPLVAHAFNGFNSCLFAYGQTGSGKTYTMMGADPNAVGGADAGVTPRLCLELFQMRERIEAEGHSKWSVEVGYIEVYNERVSDLLAKRKKGSKEEVFVDVREHPTRGVFIEGQELREVSSLDEVLGLIEAGNRVRHTAATKMNDRSSRSHAIFMLLLREERSMQTATGQTITTAGKNSRMNLVDLAGSERVAQSEVVGQQFSEARHINLSLTTLGRVIDMLADMTKNKDSQWSMPPYRESKLTFLLKDSLGGNSKTFMIATVSPSGMNYEETLSTLRYASRARDIVNVTKVNENPRALRIRELEEQMEQMRKDIQGKDPAYVAELEEQLRLLEAETQKRAADLQALEREREKNEIHEKMLRATEAERQELLSRAGALERQSQEQRAELERQNAQLADRMRQLESECEAQQRLLHELELLRDEHESLQRAVMLLRTEVEEMDQRHDRTTYHLLAVMELHAECYEAVVARLGVEHEHQLNQNARWDADERAALERRNEEGLAERDSALSALQEALDDCQRRLDESETAEEKLRVAYEALEKEKDGIHENMKLLQQAKTEVEQSLEAMTSERDGLRENLLSLKKDYDFVVTSCAKLRVDMSLADLEHQDELARLRIDNDAFAAELRRALGKLNASEVRLKYLRSLCKSAGLGGSAESGEDYQVTRSVLAMRKT
ncbi:putative kinesin-like protein [Trypanosoma cruzi]|uniref:Kinesin-like protein, putative n=2 Tax=Trypanosoma cruzi TaxID=5693 RepID=Q4CWP0_TRYCC|nr:kinesin-like protein, putative [Trypanosoma cruzi]EAN84692.1 kinesin-like protein, putative [Trypanosoma cruzi]PWV07426.1 putative kinesin-like protein [Trypanosoma cruzi]|eukprot:XP_806543.1 kinesin-like protein [Trypanosoma cruzi strain CL Brener]